MPYFLNDHRCASFVDEFLVQLKNRQEYWDPSEWFSKARNRKRKTFSVSLAKITLEYLFSVVLFTLTDTFPPRNLYARDWCALLENKTRTPIDFANDYDNLPVPIKTVRSQYCLCFMYIDSQTQLFHATVLFHTSGDAPESGGRSQTVQSGSSL